jgi:hypothetical protein
MRVSVAMLRIDVAMEMLLRFNGDLQDSTVALVINIRNMCEVSMEGSYTFLKDFVQTPFYHRPPQNLGYIPPSQTNHTSRATERILLQRRRQIH